MCYIKNLTHICNCSKRQFYSQHFYSKNIWSIGRIFAVKVLWTKLSFWAIAYLCQVFLNYQIINLPLSNPGFFTDRIINLWIIDPVFWENHWFIDIEPWNLSIDLSIIDLRKIIECPPLMYWLWAYFLCCGENFEIAHFYQIFISCKSYRKKAKF